MGKSTTPILKRCKKLGLNPLVLGYGKVSKRNQKETRRKKSEYALQLDEKQKLFDAFADESEAAMSTLAIDDRNFGDIVQAEIDRINEKNGNA